MRGIGGWFDVWNEGRGSEALFRMSRGMCRGEETRREAFLTGTLGMFAHGQALVYRDGLAAACTCDTGEFKGKFEKHKEKTADFLTGSFALAIGDGRRGELLLSRGDANSPPLYYRREEGRLFFTTELRGLLAMSEGAERVARTRLLAHLSAPVGTFPTESFFEGIRVLPVGHTLAADRLGVRVSAHRVIPLEEEEEHTLCSEQPLLNEETLLLALHEGLAAFECPAFDHAMPSFLWTVGKATGRCVTVEDETMFWNLDYAHERAARLGARLGKRIRLIPPKTLSGRGRELRQMEALLRERLARVDPCLLSYLFEGRQEALIGGEKRIETRIRRLGLMLQSVEWSRQVAIL